MVISNKYYKLQVCYNERQSNVWHLAYNIVAIEQLMGIVPLIKERPAKSTYVIDFTHCIIKYILYSGNNYVYRISEEYLKYSWLAN
jgi:hypothetical protein